MTFPLPQCYSFRVPIEIRMVSPAPPDSLYGNSVTAQRWAAMLTSLGHGVTISREYGGEPCDLLVALHARKSAGSIRRFRQEHPAKPLLVGLTGTDLYRDIHRFEEARHSLHSATRLIVLQPLAEQELDRDLRPKIRVIYQSVERTSPPPARKEGFHVCVAGHLREVKDPMRAALASRLLPASSRIRIEHFGEAIERGFADQARSEQESNPRYRWHGAVERDRFRRELAACHLLVLSSRMEGGANVISEAAVDGVPVLASRIRGSIGLLGEGYPGYFEVGDTQALAGLMLRAEQDQGFYSDLSSGCEAVAGLFDPTAEREAWRRLLEEVCG